MSDCCPHAVERHAYNGCAECGCSVRWPEHPKRLLDKSVDGLIANADQLVRAVADRDRLAAIVEQWELDYACAMSDWRRVLAERDSALSTIAKLTEERDAAWLAADWLGEELEQVVGGDGTTMDRFRRLVEQRDSAVAEAARMRAVYEAALEWCGATDGEPMLRSFDHCLRAAISTALSAEKGDGR